MSKPTQLTGVVSAYSNSYGEPTGYGEQIKIVIDRLKKSGVDVAMLSNYGLEGNINSIETAHGKIPHYPRGLETYSTDVAPLHHNHFKSQHKGKRDLFFGLYDCWVIPQNKGWDSLPIAWYVPLDHATMPPKVEAFLRRKNVTPIAMSPFGVEQMKAKGIDCEYAPHSIDTKIFKPTYKIQGQDVRDYMGTEGKFVVGIVAANKASGMIHRKAFSETLLAFSIFQKTHPDAVLYIHTDPLGQAGGWNLIKMMQALDIPKEAVCFPPFLDYKYGIPQTDLAALYTGMDVLLAQSYGGGFEVPIIEAQACGTRVIGTSWTAPKDLVAEDGWLTTGVPFWDAGQDAFWQMPAIPSIVEALEQAYNAPRERSQVAIDFAADFDSDVVWEKHWLPIFKKLLK
jgi:glycosyltransferase involved in cell wall biosynthesis